MSELRGSHLHFDCVSGAAGDMALGALIDLGVPEQVICDSIERLGLGGDRLTVTRVVKGGVSSIDVKVDVKVRTDPAESQHHHHDHHRVHHHDRQGSEHVHRHYRDIEAMIRAADLAPALLECALDMFARVARAEAKIHGVSPADVAFHEVGAIDSIVDIVATAAALTWLAPASVSAASVAVGSGSLTCAHGVMPVPSPAALEILREAGGVIESGGLGRELCTPTGAAILASAVTEWTPMPQMVPVAIGYGAGDMDLADRANVLRVTAGHREDAFLLHAADGEIAVRIDANIDDMNPELCEHAASCAIGAGALDVWWTPIVMKKSRPALLFSALAPQRAASAVMDAVLRETTTIGVRFQRVLRRTLAREVAQVDTEFGRLPVKLARQNGAVVNAAPEYEPCREAAVRHGVALKRVFAAVLAALAKYPQRGRSSEGNGS